jgi:polyhydroxybutyrate depolymerase
MQRQIYGLLLAWLLTVPEANAQTVERMTFLDGRERTYLVHVPPQAAFGKRLPLVLVFHGGGGDAKGIERLTHFSDLADRKGFYVVYPNGVNRHWQDGRDFYKNGVNDIAFVKQILAEVRKSYNIDDRYIFATGISNGGIFSHYVGALLADRIAAIAPVVGGMSEPFAKQFAPSSPISVFILQGTEDPLVPYEGGNVAKTRGRIISTQETIKLWVHHNKTDRLPKTTLLPDVANDGCRIWESVWNNGGNGTSVKLYRVVGGGHTWFGGRQYLPIRLIGRTCHDFDATSVIWDFFQNHPKPKK